MEQKYYTPDEIAELLQMHPKTIRRYIREGKLKATKIGKGWRVSGHDLTVFAEGMPLTTEAKDANESPVKVSAVVDVTVRNPDDVMRLMNFVASVQDSSKASFVTINGQYIQHEEVFRMMLWGNLFGVHQLMGSIQSLIG